MLYRTCTAQIKRGENMPDNADYTAPTRKHELDHRDHRDHTDHTDHTDHKDHTDQEYICPERST